jgi:hypothetical protein
MKYRTIVFIFLMVASASLYAGDSVYYYGVNGKPVTEPGQAIYQKELKRVSAKRYRVRTGARSDEGFRHTRTERIRLREDGTLVIRYRESGLFSRKFLMHTEKTDSGMYRFSEERSGEIIRTGYSSSLVPVHLEGEIVEFYPGGQIKSESLYSNNMLVSNKNYNPDGTEYIHNIFYSTDQHPMYKYGAESFRNFVMARLEKTGIPDIQDNVIIGAVVMETGELEGVKILEGHVSSVNHFFKETVELLPGKWEPAVLNGEKVRSFIQIPFRLNNNQAEIRYLHMSKDGQLFYHY